jgi:alkylhydroperoxidase/carboxymuconolactone decarboxylase family protein YurZ
VDNLLELNKELQKYKDMVGQAAPVVATTHDMFMQEVYKDAALSSKVKRLIGVAIGVRSGSFSCMVNQTRRAVEAGATKEEVMESVSVAIAMGGTSTIESGAKVAKVLQELGRW